MSRQKLGQHFLRSSSALQRIADALLATPGERVLEIGPGKGALTQVLLDAGYQVEAVELDSALIDHLRQQWPEDSFPLRVHHADVLEADLCQWGPVAVAGNLPYYITSPILRKLFAMGGHLRRAVLLIQLEVAERLVAKPGTRDYGFLSVLTQLHVQPEILFRVPPGAFHIPPKVQSAVVRLTPHAAPLATDPKLEAFLGWCFAQKRKTLRNNLKPHFPAPLLDGRPEMSRRAEELPLAELIALFRSLTEAGIQAGSPEP